MVIVVVVVVVVVVLVIVTGSASVMEAVVEVVHSGSGIVVVPWLW